MLTTFRRGYFVIRFCCLLAYLSLSGLSTSVLAIVRMPALFSDNMVLQREMKVPIWGWADPGEKVTVTLPNQKLSTVADETGRWQVTTMPLVAGGSFMMTIDGNNRLNILDVQVGDVWLCSGQSNMEWSLSQARDADLEVPAANFPGIRMISVANEGSQEPMKDFKGRWELCTPSTAAEFSAVGYFFGRQMHESVKVPIGLIDNSWGGSACEAWVRRDLLEQDPIYKQMLADYDAQVAKFNEPPNQNYQQRLAIWQKKAAAAMKAGEADPPGTPWWANPITGQYRPASLYNARIKPLLPYAIRGVIWYQGESNAGRAKQYREMFPLMIKNWRDDWGQGDFPFLYVQLADFMKEQNQPGDSDWAEQRESQTVTQDVVPKTGQAVIVDLGETNDIHPRNKQDVARRLARLALAKAYGQPVAADSPRYKSMYKQGETILIRFDKVNGKLQTPDNKPITGFAIAGSDRKWVWADAKIVGDGEVEVHSDAVRDPFAVRYAWADNPVCNLYDSAGLPATPFRTDAWLRKSAAAKAK